VIVINIRIEREELLRNMLMNGEIKRVWSLCEENGIEATIRETFGDYIDPIDFGFTISKMRRLFMDSSVLVAYLGKGFIYEETFVDIAFINQNGDVILGCIGGEEILIIENQRLSTSDFNPSCDGPYDECLACRMCD
jgi:hypothetical protein